MYLHVHLYLQIKFKISHIFTYNRMLINFDQTRLAKKSSKVIIHSFTHSVVRRNPPREMSFGFQVWEHNTELSLLTDSRQNFRRLIKVRIYYFRLRSGVHWPGSLLIFCWNIQLLKSSCHHKDNSKILLKLILRNQLTLKANQVHKGFSSRSVLYARIDNCLSNEEFICVHAAL